MFKGLSFINIFYKILNFFFLNIISYIFKFMNNISKNTINTTVRQ